MRGEEEPAEDIRRIFLKCVADGDEVAQALGHFPAVYREVAGVHPNLHERLLARGRFLLGNFRFMMGKFYVYAPAMNIILRAEVTLRYCRVFNVPARPAPAELGAPGGFAVGSDDEFLNLPRKVLGIAVFGNFQRTKSALLFLLMLSSIRETESSAWAAVRPESLP